MIKMKVLLLLLLMVVAAACSEQKATQPAAAVADNEENRLAAAKKHLEVVPPQDLLKEMSAKVVKMLPEKSQKVFLEVMNSKSLQDATYEISLKALAKHFTVNEIHALTNFYGSPEGKTVRQKYGDYMADVMPQVNQAVIGALQQVSKEEGQEEPKGPHGQVKPAEPKGPHIQIKPTEPKDPKAQPEKKEPQKTQPQPGPQGAK